MTKSTVSLVEVPSINYDFMTFDDTLCDGSSFSKLASLIEHFPSKFRLKISFSLLLVIFKHEG